MKHSTSNDTGVNRNFVYMLGWFVYRLFCCLVYLYIVKTLDSTPIGIYRVIYQEINLSFKSCKK
jgi:hypothetical protein